MKLKHAALTHVGAVRSENQDSIYALPEHGVFLVADGMGGEKAGEEASQQVVQTVSRIAKEFFSKVTPDSPGLLEKMAKRSLEIASQEVYQISVKEPEKSGLGSTGSLLMLHRGAYFIAQVGDSRVYMIRGGKVRQITRDHTVVWTLYESGILTREQLETHPERHLLTQCIGGSKPVEVDVFADEVREGDVFLICSDGLTGYAGENEVIKTVIDPIYTIDELAQKMLRSALVGGGGDNISIILVKVESLEPGDDWAPKIGDRPETVPPTPIEDFIPSPHMADPVTNSESPKSRVGLFAAIGLLVLLGLLAFAVFMRDGAEIQVELKSAANLSNVNLIVYGADGEVIEKCVKGREGNVFLLDVPDGAPFSIEASGLGVETTRQDFDPNAFEEGPAILRLGALGVLKIEPPSEPLRSLTIIEDPENDGPVIYSFPNGEASIPEFDHTLQPNVPYSVTINDGQGQVFSYQVELVPGQTERVKATFD